MSIINVQDLLQQGSELNANNHPLLPAHDNKIGSSRIFISGKSGSGKTSVLISAILLGQIKFDHIYLYCKSPEQAKWQYLIKFINTLEKDFEQRYGQKIDLITIKTRVEEIIPVDNIPSNRINIAIFDDMLTSVKTGDIINDYFIRSRHKNVSCWFITQVYHKKELADIRKNSDYFLIFGVSSKKELVVIGQTHSMEDDIKTFYKKFNEATKNTHDFFLIDTRTTLDILKNRKNWTGVWNEWEEKYDELDPETLQIMDE